MSVGETEGGVAPAANCSHCQWGRLARQGPCGKPANKLLYDEEWKQFPFCDDHLETVERQGWKWYPLENASMEAQPKSKNYE